MKCLLECADVSNQTRPRQIAEQWTERALEEFNYQGEQEKICKVPITPLMNKNTRSKGGSQLGFIKAICDHAWTVWTNLVDFDPTSNTMMLNLEINKEKWRLLAEDEK